MRAEAYDAVWRALLAYDLPHPALAAAPREVHGHPGYREWPMRLIHGFRPRAALSLRAGRVAAQWFTTSGSGRAVVGEYPGGTLSRGGLAVHPHVNQTNAALADPAARPELALWLAAALADLAHTATAAGLGREQGDTA